MRCSRKISANLASFSAAFHAAGSSTARRSASEYQAVEDAALNDHLDTPQDHWHEATGPGDP